MGTRKNVPRFSRSAIQLFNPKKRTYDIHRPNSSDITQGQRTLLKKIMTRGYMYRIFGRQQFNYSTKKSAYITYQFPKWQCVKVKYTEESVPNRKYFLRTNTTIQQVKKAITSWKFHPKSVLSKKRTSSWKHTSF